MIQNHYQPIDVVDYPVQLSSQLQQLLKSLRKSRHMTQAELARRLGVVQSRVADIERDPGAVSVEQLLQVMALLGAQLVVRDNASDTTSIQPGISLEAHARVKTTSTMTLTTGPAPSPSAVDLEGGSKQDDAPRGQW